MKVELEGWRLKQEIHEHGTFYVEVSGMQEYLSKSEMIMDYTNFLVNQGLLKEVSVDTTLEVNEGAGFKTFDNWARNKFRFFRSGK